MAGVVWTTLEPWSLPLDPLDSSIRIVYDASAHR
jgi:hypothetical protein